MSLPRGDWLVMHYSAAGQRSVCQERPARYDFRARNLLPRLRPSRNANEVGPQKGTGIAGGIPQTGTGIVDADPAEVVAKALLCFNNKYIYSSCEEAYRLTETGNLNLPPEYVDPYCSGPCLAETHLVLDCIENIMKNFVFYNKATIQDVRDTIKAGCSYGPERGNFDVSEHLQAENNNAYNSASQILLGLGFMFAGPALFL